MPPTPRLRGMEYSSSFRRWCRAGSSRSRRCAGILHPHRLPVTVGADLRGRDVLRQHVPEPALHGQGATVAGRGRRRVEVARYVRSAGSYSKTGNSPASTTRLPSLTVIDVWYTQPFWHGV